MFAKSKRFQEGAKDYIPGPGEYDVPTEEMNRRGRFGYNGAGRFSESLLSVDSTFSDYTYVGENSPSSLSTVSSGSKNDDRSRHGSNISYQFEKYRQAMQKEIDSLQTRGRKLEASLQTVATEKTELQASVLEKELELADVRQKNNALQKTVARQEKTIEKSPKIVQLQKKLDQAEKELDSSRLETVQFQTSAFADRQRHEVIVADNQKIIGDLRTQVATHLTAIRTLETSLEETKRNAKLADEASQEALQSLRRELELTSKQLNQREADNTRLQHTVSTLESELNQTTEQLHQTTEHLLQTTDSLQKKQDECTCLQHTIDALESGLEQTTDKLDQTADQLYKQTEALNQTTDELAQKKTKIDELQTTLQGLETNLDQTTVQLDETTSQLAHTAEHLNKTAETLCEKQTENAGLQQTVQDLESNLSQTSDQLCHTTDQLNQTTERLESKAAENTVLMTKVDNLEASLETTQNTLEHTNGVLDKTAEELSQTKETLEETIGSLNETTTALDETIIALDETTASLDETKASLAAEEAQTAELRASLSHLEGEHEQLQVLAADEREEHCKAVEQYRAEHAILSQAHDSLQHTFGQQTETLNGLELRVAADEQEIARHLWTIGEQKLALETGHRVLERLQTRFGKYRSHMEQVNQALRTRQAGLEADEAAEWERTWKELQKAKSFINLQALQMNGLKADLHWLTCNNRQMHQLGQALHRDAVAQAELFQAIKS